MESQDVEMQTETQKPSQAAVELKKWNPIASGSGTSNRRTVLFVAIPKYGALHPVHSRSYFKARGRL